MTEPEKIDLHMHTTISDGTDTPEELLCHVAEAGITLFSVTDHDAIKCSRIIPSLLRSGSPRFIAGVEFSCRDEEGKYHILGYGYDPDAESIQETIEAGHNLRITKLQQRLDLLRDEYNVVFPEEEITMLRSLDNPGKPHLGNLMVKYGYAPTKEAAIKNYINKLHYKNAYIPPETAIKGILGAGGIPVLAHPSYGSGEEIIVGEEMDHRLRKLIGYGLRGVEAFYSGFTPKLQAEVLDFAGKYDLYVTAGSDYHGQNKMVKLGDNNLDSCSEYPRGLRKFLADVRMTC